MLHAACVASRRSDPVATAFAWEEDADVGTDLARLHWLGVVPKHRRHGLARALVSSRRVLARAHVQQQAPVCLLHSMRGARRTD